jgi:hypothetical protein
MESKGLLMTKVTYQAEYLRSLPNYENFKGIYGIEDDVRSGESVDDAKARIEAKVDGWLQDRIERLDAEVAGR